MYTARYLGAESFGILSFALAFTGTFAIFSDLGLNMLTVRQLARNKTLTSKFIGNITVIKLVLSLITFVLIALTINLLDYTEKTIIVVYLIALSVIISNFSKILYSIFQAHENLKIQSIGEVLNSLLLLIFALIVISLEFQVTAVAFSYFLVSVIVLGYSLSITVHKFGNPNIELDWDFCKSTIKEALPFGLSSLFVVIYFNIDSIMLSFIKGDEVVGWYNASYKLVYVFLFIPSAFFASVYPLMAKYYQSSEEMLQFVYIKCLKSMMIIAYPLAIGITVFADKIILLIYSEEYLQSIAALQILIWAVFFSYIAHATMYTLNSINRQIIYTKVAFLGMVLNVILNLILIPQYSHIGASIATVITEMCGFLLMFYSLKHHFRDSIKYMFIGKFGLVSLIITLTLFFIQYLGVIEILFLPVIGTYLAMLYLSGVVTKNDLTLFNEVFSKKNKEEAD
jgi:O-antigen/teichoic acid export membrane protein